MDRRNLWLHVCIAAALVAFVVGCVVFSLVRFWPGHG